jgi:hypothetical protein
MAAKQYLVEQKWASLALALGLVLFFSWFADCSLFAGRNILKLIEVREPGVPVRA